MIGIRKPEGEDSFLVAVLGHHRVVALGVLERLLDKRPVVAIAVHRLVDHLGQDVAVLILVLGFDHLCQWKPAVGEEGGLIIGDERAGGKKLHVAEPPRVVVEVAVLGGHVVLRPALFHIGDPPRAVIGEVEDAEAVPGDLGQAPVGTVDRGADDLGLLGVGARNQRAGGVKGGLVEDQCGDGALLVVGAGDLAHPVQDAGDVAGGIHLVLGGVLPLERPRGKGDAGDRGGEGLLQGDDIHRQGLLDRPVDCGDVHRIPRRCLRGEGGTKKCHSKKVCGKGRQYTSASFHHITPFCGA